MTDHLWERLTHRLTPHTGYARIRIERTRHPKSVHGKPKKVQGKKKAGHGDRPALSVWHGNQGMAAVRLMNKGMTITVVHASMKAFFTS